MSNPCPRDVILLKNLMLCEPRRRSIRFLRYLTKQPFQQCRRERHDKPTNTEKLDNPEARESDAIFEITAHQQQNPLTAAYPLFRQMQPADDSAVGGPIWASLTITNSSILSSGFPIPAFLQFSARFHLLRSDIAAICGMRWVTATGGRTPNSNSPDLAPFWKDRGHPRLLPASEG